MFRKHYVAFLNDLSKLAKSHDELTDTDVRERLHEVINYHFVWGKPIKGFPKRFAMMSTAADRKVAAAVKKFVAGARRIADDGNTRVGAARHALLEDTGAKTRRGELYDVFLGSTDRVSPARKPAPDSQYAQITSKKKYRAEYDPQELAITFRGKRIVPTFNTENAFYEYRHNRREVGLHQDYYLPEDLRKKALDHFHDRPDPPRPMKPVR